MLKDDIANGTAPKLQPITGKCPRLIRKHMFDTPQILMQLES